MKRKFSVKGKILNKKGFTLIELIVVMAVIAIIAAIALPKYLGIQDKAKLDADYSTGIMLAKAAELYIAAEDTTPTTFTVAKLIEDNYYADIAMQSSKFKDFTADKFIISYTETEVNEIKAVDGVTTEILFPEPSTP